MKNLKKLLALSLAVMLLLAAVPFSAIMASAEVPETLTLDSVEAYLADLGDAEVDASVASWLKSYFVSGATLTYKAADLEKYPNVKAYFAGGLLTDESAAFSYGNSSRVMLPQSVLKTGISQKVVTAIDYSAPASGKYLWSLIPAIPGFTDYSLADSDKVAIFQFSAQDKAMYDTDSTTKLFDKVSIRPVWYTNYAKNGNTSNIWADSAAAAGKIEPVVNGNFTLNDWVEFDKDNKCYKYVGGDTVVISADYTYSDYSASDNVAKISDTDNISAMKLTATYKVWVESDENYVLDSTEKALHNLKYSVYYRYDNTTSDGTPYFSLVKDNFALFDYISIESELPKDELFLAHYKANKDSWTKATLSEAVELYNGITDENKTNADIAAAYADIKAAAKELYYTDSKLEYTNEYVALKGLVFEAEDSGYLKVATDDLSTTVGQKVKVAFAYDPATATPTVGVDILPSIPAIGTTTTTPQNNNLFYLHTRTYPTSATYLPSNSVYAVDWIDYGNISDTKTVYKVTNAQYTSALGGNASFSDYAEKNYKTVLENYGGSETKWKYKANNVVMEFEYYYSDYTAKDSLASAENSGLKATLVEVEKINMWAENDGNNTYNEGTDILLHSPANLAQNLIYRYDATKTYTPYVSFSDCEQLNYLYVENLTDEDVFMSDNSPSITEKTVVSTMLPVLQKYAALDKEGVVSKETKDIVTTQAERLNLMPLNLGATVRTDAAEQNIAFYGKAPALNGNDATLASITKIGVVMKTYNAMVADGDKELTIETEGAVSKEITADETTSLNNADFRFTLSGTDLKNSGMWGKWIVSRIYAEYTMADGSTFILYSLDTNDANPVSDDFTYGTCVRSVNGVLKSMANAVYGGLTDESEENATLKTKLEAVTGEAYNDVSGATVETYVGKNLTDGYTLAGAENGIIKSSAEEMLYFLLAFKNAVALVA